ncbi:MAG: ubiquinone biosynthesis protein UbiB, partial [Azorhizobium sp. 35-67-15]
DPQLNMWTTAAPVVEDWIARNLGPIGRIQEAGGAIGEVGSFLADVPDLLGRAGRVVTQLDEATRDGLSLSPKTLEGIGQAEARRAFWGNAALWVIALSLLVIALR